MRSLLPLRRILSELVTALDLEHDGKSTIKSTVWEDNTAARTLATTNPPRHTPKSRYFNCKWHWFREHLTPGPDGIEVQPVLSEDQIADAFTKPLKKDVFICLHKRLLGW